MKFLLSDEVQVEGYAKMLNLTTRSDMADNKYFEEEPLVQGVAKAREVGRTPYTLKSFELIVIDGCNSWQALVRVYLPAIRPAIVTVALFAFITSWNEFLAALVIMNRGATFTLPLVVAAARQETSIGGTDWGLLQAGVTVSVIPCVLFYVLLQKYYVSGFLSGVVK